MNNVAQLCEETGADVESVRKGITTDQRIGRHFLYPGAGYGGSCFPKDVKALIKTGANFGVAMDIVQAAEDVNDRQKEVLYNKVKKHFGDVKGRTIALWGLSFKPNTDDMREAPSLVVIEKLLRDGAKVQAYDPVATHEAKKALAETVTEARLLENMSFKTSAYGALEGADALCLVTEWSEFRTPDFAKIKAALKQPVIFDGRNIFSPEAVREKGFKYYAIGRP
jgi:UDPglucose 6-dehydrogenase